MCIRDSPGTVTFPIKVYSMVRFPNGGLINAASTIIIVLTIIATVIAMRLQEPVSYTHLDVYKRQGLRGEPYELPLPSLPLL